MNVYIAGISGDEQYFHSLRSFENIRLGPGDTKQGRSSGRGDVARRLACGEFLEGKWDAIAMLDMDMLHDPDLVLKLANHNLDMVTGHYYAGNSRNVHSVCWDVGDGKWPYPPLTKIPRSGLHEIAVTGMGNVLIKREVVESVAKYLPKGDHPFAIGPAPEITGDASSLGTDFRFFSIARKLGYKLWLDADIESKHGVLFWVGHEIADKLYNPQKTIERLEYISLQMKEVNGMDEKFFQLRIERLETQLKDLQKQKADYASSMNFLDRQILAVTAVLSEDKFLVKEMQGTFPVVPDDEREALLQSRTTIQGATEGEAKKARGENLKTEAKGFINDLQTIRGSGQLP